MKRNSVDHRTPLQGALVIHPTRPRAAIARSGEERLEEAIGLAEALDLEIRDGLIVPVRTLSPSSLFGSGKVAEIASICRELDIDVAVVDDALSPVQQRNLERAWQV